MQTSTAVCLLAALLLLQQTAVSFAEDAGVHVEDHTEVASRYTEEGPHLRASPSPYVNKRFHIDLDTQSSLS